MIRIACVAFLLFVSLVTAAHARVIDLVIEKRADVSLDVPTGSYGPYERLEGVISFSFDPQNPQNAQIADIQYGVQNSHGQVEARANFVVLQPADPQKRRSVAWLEVSNRGRMASLRYFQGAGGQDAPYGDGLLFRQGLTLIWIGWQFDVPKGEGRLWFRPPVARQEDGSPIEGLVRSDWVLDEDRAELSLGHRTLPTIYRTIDFNSAEHQLTRRTGRDAAREVVARDQWAFSGDGRMIKGAFEAGYIYELVYKSSHPRLVGLGLAAVRDMASFAKYDRETPFHVEKVVGFGVSQTGRFLRHFLHQGFNVDEANRKVFDGVFIHTAGAGRGSFNHRFAQPSRDAHPYSAFFYPTDVFPFSTFALPDQNGLEEAALMGDVSPEYQPKMIVTNTGYEYWGRAAALVHSDWRDGSDLPQLPNERIYHLAGAQHYVGRQKDNLENGESANSLNFLPILRALSIRLVNWVENDVEPPLSQYPKRSDDSLVERKDVAYPDWIRQAADIPKPHTAYWSDFAKQPPTLLGEIEPRVPQVDAFGNELAGVRLPQLRVPVFSFIPWSKREGLTSPEALRDFEGHIVALPDDLIPASKTEFLRQSREEAQNLVGEGFLLSEDIGKILSQQSDYWDLRQ